LKTTIYLLLAFCGIYLSGCQVNDTSQLEARVKQLEETVSALKQNALKQSQITAEQGQMTDRVLTLLENKKK
jgi:hypothetical protein